MGAVYEGRHEATGARRAIKTLLAAPGAQYFEEDMRRFQREAALVTRLSHPAIVAVEEAHLDHAPPYLVMELLEGGTLRDRLRRGALPLPEALRVAIKLADALAHAHERDALHRDLKPQNVLFDAAGEPKLADFGLGRDTGIAVERLTRTGEILGTPAYMPPEQTVDAKRVDARSDIYALGCLLYAMLAGRPAFGGEGVAEILRAVRYSQPPPLRDDRDDVPVEVEAICQRAMAKDPDDRYPSAEAMGAALCAVADPGPVTQEQSVPRLREPSWRFPVSLLAALLLGAGLTALALRGPPPAAPAPSLGATPTAPTSPTPAAPTATPSLPSAPAHTPWLLRLGEPLSYQLTVSPHQPEELGLARASISVLLSMTATDVEGSRATLQAQILRTRAWAEPLQGQLLHYDSATSAGLGGDPARELLGQTHGAQLTFDLDASDGEVSAVRGLSLPTADLPSSPAAWPARTLASLLTSKGFEACWDAVARLERSGEGPDLGQVTYRRERPLAALRLADGLVWRLAQVKVRVLGPGVSLTQAYSTLRGQETGRDALRRLASVWLTNGIIDPDTVHPGWALVDPPRLDFPPPLEARAARGSVALRATPWGPLARSLRPGEVVGVSSRVVAGFRLVCVSGGLAWCQDTSLRPWGGRAVVVTDDAAYVYPTVERKPQTARGIAPRGTVYPVRDEKPHPEGEDEQRILVPYLDGAGWILLGDTEPLGG
jgi:serine/threonine-protein kinase